MSLLIPQGAVFFFVIVPFGISGIDGHHPRYIARKLDSRCARIKRSESQADIIAAVLVGSFLLNAVICAGFAPGVAVIYLEHTFNGGHDTLFRHDHCYTRLSERQYRAKEQRVLT